MTSEKIDIAIQKSSPAGLLFLFSNDCGNQKVTGHPVPERRKDDTDPVSNAIVADALLEQELVTDPQAAARLDAIRQLDDVAYDTAFEPPVSDYELDGLDLER